jgi:hypothetical protein
VLKLQVAQPDISAAAALDRQLIVDRVYRYGWAFDERRLDALRACFTEDAVWEGNTGGEEPVAPINGREQIAEWLAGFWQRQPDQRRHMMVSIVVDNQTPESADALASLILTSAQDSAISTVLTSFYRLRLVKHADSWLIAHLFEGFDVAF